MILHSPNFKYNWYKLLALFYTILLSNWPNWQFLRVCTFRGNLLFSFLYFLFHNWLSETFLQENENNTGWRRAWRRAAVLYYRQSFGAEPENDEGKAGRLAFPTIEALTTSLTERMSEQRKRPAKIPIWLSIVRVARHRRSTANQSRDCDIMRQRRPTQKICHRCCMDLGNPCEHTTSTNRLSRRKNKKRTKKSTRSWLRHCT